MPQTTKGQNWAPDKYQLNAGYVPELGLPVVDLLAPKRGEHILDLGCGDGRLTERIAACGARVFGIDASAEMLTAARARGLEVAEMDARKLTYEQEFDAVFSNATLHWIGQPNAVIAGVRRALKPGGRFVGEFGGHGNVAAIVTAALAVMAHRGVDARKLIPWYFPTSDDYAARLEVGGFRVREITLFARPTPLPTDMAGWLDTFAGPFFKDLDAEARASAVEEAVELLAPSLCDSKGRWTADYVRLRFRADRV